mmetsp:Transcript_14848/g.37724  ORF Transcript_14848/g.37724 Transcript_14848/m.37724 type:complete len:165 (-) Transcript_14848:212-706(-)
MVEGKSASALRGKDALRESVEKACESRKVLKPEALHAIVKRALGGISEKSNASGSGNAHEAGLDLDADAAALLSEVAEQMVLNTIHSAARLAQHRGGATIEKRDVARYLRTNVGLDVQSDADDLRMHVLKMRPEAQVHYERQQAAKRLNEENSATLLAAEDEDE